MLIKTVLKGSSDVTVLDLLKKLGEMKITARDLKQSQLAKIVNGLRKRTACAAISAESRRLIQRWRSMVIKQEDNSCYVKESHGEGQSSVASLSHTSAKSDDCSNFAFNCIKKSLNLPDFSSFHVSSSQEPMPDIDIEEFLERDSKRFIDNLPDNRLEMWMELEKPTRRSDGSIAMPFISLDEVNFRNHRFRL
ncbi:hypothetical protein RF11_03683 [Thelohanellus kitauei]|uniref:TFIIS N-terminal domain-containing protein n=1 Tax=Thelohanellus kitauei TaxID=669202 RepID=A0A0C2IZJ2_THEKT|nr:hypothetical protein RF11_03683 [Thelohanellus kitauei]